MINIRLLSGKLFKTIDIININNSFNYEEVKELFNSHIISNKYYKIISDNNQNIYTNLYDIYEIKNTKNIILNNELNIIFLPYKKKDVDEIKLWSIHHHPLNIYEPFIHNFSNELLSDKLFVLMMVNHWGGYFYRNVSSVLQNDEQIIINAALSDKFINLYNPKFSCLEYIPEHYKNNKNLFQYFINIEGTVIKYASYELKNNKELAKLAIQNNPYSIQYISEELKNDKELVKLAIQNNPESFQYILEKFRNDKEIIIECIKVLELQENNYDNNMLAYINSDEIKDDEDIILPLMKINGRQLGYASSRLRKNKNIVYTAIKNHQDAYSYPDESFYKDKEFILLSLNHKQQLYDIDDYSDFLEDYEENIIDDKNIVLAAVKKSGLNFKYASLRLKDDKEIVITSILNCFDTSSYDEMSTSFNDLVTLVNSMKELDETINMIIDNTSLKYDSDVLQTVIQKKQEHNEEIYKTIKYLTHN